MLLHSSTLCFYIVVGVGWFRNTENSYIKVWPAWSLVVQQLIEWPHIVKSFTDMLHRETFSWRFRNILQFMQRKVPPPTAMQAHEDCWAQRICPFVFLDLSRCQPTARHSSRPPSSVRMSPSRFFFMHAFVCMVANFKQMVGRRNRSEASRQTEVN